MKILMINSVCGIRSTGRICTDLATELENLGHDVKIAYGRESVPEQFEKYAVRIGTNLDVKIHALRARMCDESGFGSKKATEKFIKWVREYKPDVIHLHNIHGYYINIEILFDFIKKEFNGKVIWTFHDCWALTGHTPYCDTVDCYKWKTGCFSCPLKKQYPRSLIDNSKRNWEKKKKIFNGGKNLTIVTPSRWMKSLVEKSFLSSYKVEVINNGIDTNVFHPIQSSFKDEYEIKDKTMLLSVATSWDDMKGYSDFIRLSKKISEKYKIVLVGLTKKQLSELPSTIIGIERTSSIQELVDIYNAADLYLNLSYCENYPTVNIEAMSCGTPVLTYKTGGSVEIIKEYGGYIVDKGDLNKIVNILNSKDRIISVDNFDEEKNDNRFMLKQYINIIS